MERIFTNVPDGLPEDYPEHAPENGSEVNEWKSTNRRIFNTLHELNPFDEPTAIIEIDKWGLESFKRDPSLLLPDQTGFIVISRFQQINSLGSDHQRLVRLDAGAAYRPKLRELKLVLDRSSPGTEFEHWAFLFRVAERLV